MDETIKYFNTSIDDVTCTIAFKFRQRSPDLVIFLHGLGCAMHSFDMAFESPYLRDLSLLSMDFPGFGASSRPERFPYTLKSHAQAIENLLAIYPSHRHHIVAHSMGAAIALLLPENRLKHITTFVNIEGNLIREDCGLISRNSSDVSFETFVKHHFKRTKNPLWNTEYRNFSLDAASPWAFYKSAKSLVYWSESGKLLKIFTALKCRKAYVYGDKNKEAPVLATLEDLEKIPVAGCGHFVMNDNPDHFYRILGQLIG